MPENNIHRGDNELGGWQNHSHYHNVIPENKPIVILQWWIGDRCIMHVLISSNRLFTGLRNVDGKIYIWRNEISYGEETAIRSNKSWLYWQPKICCNMDWRQPLNVGALAHEHTDGSFLGENSYLTIPQWMFFQLRCQMKNSSSSEKNIPVKCEQPSWYEVQLSPPFKTTKDQER